MLSHDKKDSIIMHITLNDYSTFDFFGLDLENQKKDLNLKQNAKEAACYSDCPSL